WRGVWSRVGARATGDEAEMNKPLRVMLLLAALALGLAGMAVLGHRSSSRMTTVAIALKRYELRHSKFPSSLDALVPEFMAELPWDCMSGKSFCYRLNVDG